MSVTHADIYQTAVTLSTTLLPDGTCCESNLRSSASRAYYAALHAAMVSLPDQFSVKQSQTQSGSSHEAVNDAMTRWGKSMTPGKTEAQIIARGLPALKKLRKRADYRLDEDFPAADAQEAISRANKLIRSSEYALSQCGNKQTA